MITSISWDKHTAESILLQLLVLIQATIKCIKPQKIQMFGFDHRGDRGGMLSICCTNCARHIGIQIVQFTYITYAVNWGLWQFLLLSIEWMRSLTLLNSLSRNISESARLIERQLQTEWLLAATTAIPLGSSINPDEPWCWFRVRSQGLSWFLYWWS